MEFIVENEILAGLDWIAKHEWIKKTAQRDKLIQYAIDNQKQEALAWLMDYKNKTADLVAEAAKEEAKMMRELMENPNSVSALKKIWSYKKLEDNTLMITSYKGMDLEIEVPTTIGKSQVSVIGEWAFSYAADRIKNEEIRKKIKSVVLPEGLKEIQHGAFAGCESLMHVTLPSTLQNIGETAFRNCTSLQAVSLPEKIKVIHHSAFSGCTKLYNGNGFLILSGKLFSIQMKSKQMAIPEGVTQLLATDWSPDVTKITLPESLQVIGAGVFKNSYKLVRVDIGDNVHTIGAEAFYRCVNVKEIVLPKHLKKIEKLAFYGCGLRELKIPEEVEKIGAEAFVSCSGLIDIHIPASVKQIGKNIFGTSARGVYIHTPEGSYAETFLKEYPGVTIIHDEI